MKNVILTLQLHYDASVLTFSFQALFSLFKTTYENNSRICFLPTFVAYSLLQKAKYFFLSNKRLVFIINKFHEVMIHSLPQC